MTEEERARIAREYGVTVPDDIKVQKLPPATYAMEASYSRREAYDRSRKVTQRHWKFQAAERKRKRRERENGRNEGE